PFGDIAGRVNKKSLDSMRSGPLSVHEKRRCRSGRRFTASSSAAASSFIVDHSRSRARASYPGCITVYPPRSRRGVFFLLTFYFRCARAARTSDLQLASVLLNRVHG